MEGSTYHEYVVPRSMPMIVPMSSFAFSANACGKAAAIMRNTTVFFIVILTLRCLFFMDYLSSVTMSSLLIYYFDRGSFDSFGSFSLIRSSLTVDHLGDLREIYTYPESD